MLSMRRSDIVETGIIFLVFTSKRRWQFGRQTTIVHSQISMLIDWSYYCLWAFFYSLQWRHECDGVSYHQPHGCVNRLFKRRSKKTPKLRLTGLCEGNSPVTGEFPAHKSSNAENVSIWWRHHVRRKRGYMLPISNINRTQYLTITKYLIQSK